MNSGAAASPRSRRALRRVHWRSRIVIAGKRCEISKALRQRSSAIRFQACQRSIGENANGLTDEAAKGVQSAATCSRHVGSSVEVDRANYLELCSLGGKGAWPLDYAMLSAIRLRTALSMILGIIIA